MEITLRLRGHTFSVQLLSEGDGHTATVDGAAHHVTLITAVPAGPNADEVTVALDGRTRRAVVARTRDRVVVALAGRVFTFEIGDADAGGHAAGAGSGVITAPMPGKIVAVRVAVGDAVEVGTPLVVLEAMKMESTLASEVGGRVAAVRVDAGALVAAGDVLVEITPAPPA